MVTAAIWIAVIVMWILVGLRIFFTVVMFKFAKEGTWIEANAGNAMIKDSHPCRQTKK